MYSFLKFWTTHTYPSVPLWGHSYTCFEVLVASPLGFNAIVQLGRGENYACSLRFTSGVTPADLFVANMAVRLFSYTYLQIIIGGSIMQLPHSVQLLEVRYFQPVMFQKPGYLNNILIEFPLTSVFKLVKLCKYINH